MTKAAVARRDGDAFQGRLFWLKAARLLDDESSVSRVGFETGPKGFDDIWVEYESSRAPVDQEGEPLLREHLQCKWHVTPSNYGWVDLTDPDFINASSTSLLQRAHAAQVKFAPRGVGERFTLVTNWRIRQEDALRRLVRKRSNTLDLELLFSTARDTSVMGAARKAWRDHLTINDAQLRSLARTMAFAEATDSLDDLRERLDDLFGLVGLRRIPANESAFPYDEIVFQWLAQGRLEFDRKGFQAACRKEGLLGRGGSRHRVFGVKSFEHPIDRLEDRCVKVLNLVHFFDERYIRSEQDWESKIYPDLRAFLLEAAKGSDRLRLAIDAHATVAFAAGTVLNIKAGRSIELEQRTTDRRVWSPDDSAASPDWPTFAYTLQTIRENSADLAVAVGLTHDVTDAVRAYVTREVPEVGRLLISLPSTGPSARSVACGRHAFDLAESLTARIRTEAASDKGTLVHIFVAGPNAFTFFLGQRQVAFGRVKIYEFDFEGGRGGSYLPSLVLPLADAS